MAIKKPSLFRGPVAFRSMSSSEVLRANLEEALGMGTNGACGGSLFANNHMAAVAAYPYAVIFTGEHNAFLDIGQQTTITLFVVAFYRTDHSELGGNGSETFLLGFFSHAVIHVGPFVVFALGGLAEVGHSV